MKTFSLLAVIFFLSISGLVNAQWSNNPSVNRRVGVSSYSQFSPQSIPDGQNNTIICWVNKDSRGSDIMVQKIGSNGKPMWTDTTTGKRVSAVYTDHYADNPVMFIDGAGGAIIVWLEYNVTRTYYSIRARRIRNDGVFDWNNYQIQGNILTLGSNINIHTHGTFDMYMHASKSSAGFTVCYTLGESIKAYRVTLTGHIEHHKLIMYRLHSYPRDLKTAPDQGGGVYATWTDLRHTTDGGFHLGKDIFAQHVDVQLNLVHGWDSVGKEVCNYTGDQLYPQIIEDKRNGVYICWEDFRAGGTWGQGHAGDIYAQHINYNGIRKFHSSDITRIYGGLPICTDQRRQYFPFMAWNQNGDATIFWYDDRHVDIQNFGWSIYGARINDTYSGYFKWGSNNGKIVAAYSTYNRWMYEGGYYNPTLAVYGNDESNIFTWIGHGNPSYSSSTLGVYAQKVNKFGEVQWVSANPSYPLGGRLVSLGTEKKQLTMEAQFDAARNNAGYVIAWADTRPPAPRNIYAQRVLEDGFLGLPAGNNDPKANFFSLDQNYPNPFNPETRISFNIPLDAKVSLKVYDMTGREIAVLANANLAKGTYSYTWNGSNFSSGTYFFKLTAGDYQEVRKMLLVK